MSGKLSDNRPVRNEQIIRNQNTATKDSIKKYFHNDQKVKSEPLKFACECSDINCGKHVKVDIDTYEEIHDRNDLFTIAKGHETPAVEKVVAQESTFDVVEKRELKP